MQFSHPANCSRGLKNVQSNSRVRYCRHRKWATFKRRHSRYWDHKLLYRPPTTYYWILTVFRIQRKIHRCKCKRIIPITGPHNTSQTIRSQLVQWAMWWKRTYSRRQGTSICMEQLTIEIIKANRMSNLISPDQIESNKVETNAAMAEAMQKLERNSQLNTLVRPTDITTFVSPNDRWIQRTTRENTKPSKKQMKKNTHKDLKSRAWKEHTTSERVQVNRVSVRAWVCAKHAEFHSHRIKCEHTHDQTSYVNVTRNLKCSVKFKQLNCCV